MFWLIVLVTVAVVIGCVISTFPDHPVTGYDANEVLPPDDFNALYDDD